MLSLANLLNRMGGWTRIWFVLTAIVFLMTCGYVAHQIWNDRQGVRSLGWEYKWWEIGESAEKAECAPYINKPISELKVVHEICVDRGMKNQTDRSPITKTDDSPILGGVNLDEFSARFGAEIGCAEMCGSLWSIRRADARNYGDLVPYTKDVFLANRRTELRFEQLRMLSMPFAMLILSISFYWLCFAVLKIGISLVSWIGSGFSQSR